MIEQTQVSELQTDIKQAQRVVFLTGAGVSTHSGIPDYRSKNGIYHGTAIPPEVLLSDDTLLHQPEEFHQFVMDNMYFPDAQPNLIHQKIAAICNQKGTLITQNVDGLDRKAGNKHVVEFHGNLYNIYCTTCQQAVSYQAYQHSFRHDFAMIKMEALFGQVSCFTVKPLTSKNWQLPCKPLPMLI